MFFSLLLINGVINGSVVKGEQRYMRNDESTQLSFLEETCNDDFTLLDQWDDNYGTPMLSQVIDDYTYLFTEQSSLLILNTTVKSEPILITEFITGISYPIAVNHSNEFLFLVGYYGELMILDISDPKIPVIESYLALSGETSNSIFLGDFIYTFHAFGIDSTVNDTISIIDVSNPSFPSLVSEFSFQGHAYPNGIYHYNNVLFLWQRGKVSFYNVTNLTDPIFLLDFEVADKYCRDIFCFDNYLYLQCSSQSSTSTDYSYYVYTLLNLTNPLFVKEIGNLGTFSSYQIDDTILIFLNETVKAFYNLTDPLEPELVGSFHGKYGDNYQTLTVTANYLFLVDRYFGLEIYEITSFKAEFLGEFHTGEISFGVYIFDTNVFIFESFGFEIFDATDPTNILFVEDWGREEKYPIKSLVVQESIVYVIVGNILKLIDISDPTEPIEISSLTLGISALSHVCITIQEDIVFLFYRLNVMIEYVKGLITIDCSNPEQPEILDQNEDIIYSPASIQSWSVDLAKIINPIAITLHENYAYCVHGHLVIYDISNVNDITIPNSEIEYPWSAPSGFYYQDIDIVDDKAFIADNRFGVRIYDVSNINNINLIANVTAYYPEAFCRTAFPSAISVDNDYLYAACGTDGLRAIDISNIIAPVFVGTFSAENCLVIDVQAKGNVVFVSDYLRNINVLKLTDLEITWPPTHSSVMSFSLPIFITLSICLLLAYVVTKKFDQVL